ncbi:DNA mismatch repair endonuclease MutL [Halobacteria archaeon AArc-curdl1]|uniref:DNA mismatch repair protein MutL n=1 Tax=Natronosalvus hydrolyticus TaxID=2979988 RepID=A0AAP2Z7N1_9EURY|nr:DNA mismatch repair endonuclease MutL [Halobacteria archaeon AArc-curdl1]
MTETPSERTNGAGETGKTRIHQLDENTVARIAAGEVVERPASAVKELLENSLDAGATRVEVAVEAGGTDSIRVTDDGHGMTEADLRAAVRQHTTSKITDLEDLESGVETLGFRGEALHTIGSVSKLTIRSRPRADRVDGEPPTGTELVYEGGEVLSVKPTGCPEGTTVEVTDLFYNTPARRKFLKTTATEFAHVNRIVTRYALANPDVAVSLSHDGREVFATTGQGDLLAAILAVYGRDVAQSMIAVDADEDLPVGPLEAISGTVSHPETNRSSREYLATYVNGRAVTSSAIREGIMDAYGGQLGGNRYPFVVLFLEVPGDAVDVNVHPRKREVRFDDDDAVRRAVQSAVEDALLEHGLLRSRAPRGRSAPDETDVQPDRQSALETDADSATESVFSSADSESSSAEAEAPSADSESSSAEASSSSAESVSETTANTDARPTRGAMGESGAGESGSTKADSAAQEHSGPDGSKSEPQYGDSSASDRNLQERWAGGPETGTGSENAADDHGSVSSQEIPPSSDTAGPPEPVTDRKFTGEETQQTLSGDTATGEETAYENLPPLRILGQLSETYLVCESPDGLVLIDQHAADERVNYERLQRAFDDDPTAQALASPVELELTAIEAEAFETYRDALSRLGFYADRIDDRTVAVTTVPAVLEKTLEPTQLRDVLASFVSGDHDAGAETVDALADAFLGDLACYPSITGNTSLTEGSMVDLLAALDDCTNPYACPHGRPVIIQFDYGDLEDRFERDYPGHGG